MAGEAVGFYTPEKTKTETQDSCEKNELIREAKPYKDNIERQLEESEKIKENAKVLEIMPVGGYVLFRLYNSNPYEIIEETKGGLILSTYNGMERTKETGEMEKQPRAVEIGQVVEVGPGVVDVRPGDDIFLRGGVMIPVPFLRQGFWVTGQNNILVVVNKGLTERFKKQDDGKQD